MQSVKSGTPELRPFFLLQNLPIFFKNLFQIFKFLCNNFLTDRKSGLPTATQPTDIKIFYNLSLHFDDHPHLWHLKRRQYVSGPNRTR